MACCTKSVYILIWFIATLWHINYGCSHLRFCSLDDMSFPFIGGSKLELATRIVVYVEYQIVSRTLFIVFYFNNI